MEKSLDDWQAELRVIDAGLITLLQRRMDLAVELLKFLRGEAATLGEFQEDLDRLGIFLYADIPDRQFGCLDKGALLEIFCRIIREQKRVAKSLKES